MNVAERLFDSFSWWKPTKKEKEKKKININHYFTYLFNDDRFFSLFFFPFIFIIFILACFCVYLFDSIFICRLRYTPFSIVHNSCFFYRNRTINMFLLLLFCNSYVRCFCPVFLWVSICGTHFNYCPPIKKKYDFPTN